MCCSLCPHSVVQVILDPCCALCLIRVGGGVRYYVHRRAGCRPGTARVPRCGNGGVRYDCRHRPGARPDHHRASACEDRLSCGVLPARWVPACLDRHVRKSQGQRLKPVILLMSKQTTAVGARTYPSRRRRRRAALLHPPGFRVHRLSIRLLSVFLLLLKTYFSFL